MKKLGFGLILWFVACMVFGQASASRRRFLNEAIGMVGKRVPIDWVDFTGTMAGNNPGSGFFSKKVNFRTGENYIIVMAHRGVVIQSQATCKFSSRKEQDKWLKECYDTLVSDKWSMNRNNGLGEWHLDKGDMNAASYLDKKSYDNDGTLVASVVFMLSF